MAISQSQRVALNRRPARKPRRRRWPVVVLGLLALVLLAVVAGLLALQSIYAGDLIPMGYRSMGLDLGGHPVGEAAAALQNQWSQKQVAVDLAGATQPVAPEKLGVMFDAAATARLAHDQGRSAAAMTEMVRSRQLAVPPTDVPPAWRFDPAAADVTLQAWAREVFIPAQDAAVKVVDGKVEATPSSAGRALDVAATGAALQADPWGIVNAGHFQPVIVPVQPTVPDASAVITGVQRFLATPVALHLYDPYRDEKLDWTIPPAALGDWVTVQVSPTNPSKLSWNIDEARARAYLAEQAKTLGQDRFLNLDQDVPQLLEAVTASQIQAKPFRLNLRIYHQPTQYTVKSGQTLSAVADEVGLPYPWIMQANPGLGDAIRPGQVITIPTVDKMIPLPPVENKRIVVSIKEQKMWAYENGQLKWQWVASTGMSMSPTAPGIFQIQSHDRNAYAANWDLWMPDFMGVYHPVPGQEFMNGFHGFPSRGGSQILWTKDLGHPITYGCILISSDNEKLLYDWAQDGVVVVIKNG